jgi:hypothetical protein
MGMLDFFKKKNKDDDIDSLISQKKQNAGLNYNDDLSASNLGDMNSPSGFDDYQENAGSSFNQPTSARPYQAPVQGFQQRYQYSSQDNPRIDKDLEVISTKLDMIKAILESLNQRISAIERHLYEEKQQERNKGRMW